MGFVLRDLFGMTIIAVLMSECRSYLSFLHESGSESYYLKPDCCSESWFESINGLENLIDSEVMCVMSRHSDVGSDPLIKPSLVKVTSDDNKKFKLYGYTLVTHKGYCDIEFRNASNGFYDAYCEYLHESVLEIDRLNDCALLDKYSRNDGKKIKMIPYDEKKR